jgi:PKD repeat protein
MAFTSNTIIGAAPLLIQFTDTTDGNIVSWYWEFGDGETSTEQNPSHIYTEEGRYDVSLEVTYDDDSTDTFEELGYALVDEVSLEASTKCLRYATEQPEGYGWSEFGGGDMVIPLGDNGAFTINDDNGQSRDIIIDESDYGFYEVDTCDRFVNTKPSPLDKGLSEIAWEKWEREAVVDESHENKRLKHENSHVGIRPSDTANRGKSGYTTTGQRTLQKISIEAYSNGEKLTPTAIAPKLIENGEATFTEMNVNACRVQMVIKGTCGEIEVTNHVHNYLGVVSGSPEPNNRLPGDNDIIMELATNNVLWISRGLIPLRNRCTGVILEGGTVSIVEGPDSRNSGFSCADNVTCDNIAVTSDCTIVLWSKDANLFTGISSWSTYGIAVDGWTLYYKHIIGGIAANLVILAGTKCDVRIYSKLLSSNAIEELYNNTVRFEGKKVMPI